MKKKRNSTDKAYIIIGAGGHASVVADALLQSGCTIKGYLDDAAAIGTTALGAAIIGRTADCINHTGCLFIIGIGDNSVRKRIAEEYHLEYGTAIHPTAVIGQNVEIGAGSVLMAGCVINPGTVIGEHCIINTKASIDHDNAVGNFSHISPGAALGGTVNIGDGTHVGIGACIKNNVIICGNVVIGAGAAVVRDIKEPGVYVGVPAGRQVE